MTRKAILMLSTNKNVKFAGKLVEIAHMNPEDFPEMLDRMKKKAVRYYLNSWDEGIYALVDLVHDKPDLLSIVVSDLLFKSGKKNME